MAETVTIVVNDQEFQVPAGANLIDAARSIGDHIPVFCYHPKMDPVGMCRMCLVEMGSIQRDRASGDVMLDDEGKPQVRWFPTLQTACTTNVYDGLVIRTDTAKVDEARENVLEFLLTSHPLDCPICDKGGECPLQNLTMEHGPGQTRMVFTDKLKLDKHVPLGDLIFLDEERCIQCARCVRFQDEVVGDDVLAFYERGRSLQIITNSDPGFDSYFSGNTTDICPVGALTTADFRFGARPWELTEVPSIDPWDAAGSNISLSTRLDRDAGGRAIIKRVLPRQNEYVNEIWISDKARFGHHFSRSADRLANPLTGESRATWSEALQAAADALRAAGADLGIIAGSGLSNEDLFALRQLADGLGSARLGAWPPTHGGADLVAQVGVGQGTNLGQLGRGDVVLVIASDLEEEVPLWRLRIKQASDRGILLVVANARHTRLDDFACQSLRYPTGGAAHFLANLREQDEYIYGRLRDADNLVIVAGAEGLDLAGSRALMQAAANILIETGHVGRPNNGLLAPLPGPNGMGLRYLGFTPENTLDIMARPPKTLLVAQADLLADDPSAPQWLGGVDSIIELSLFQDLLGDRAAITLPVQSFAERDGSFTSGERRVQRFYRAQGPVGEALPAWQVVMKIGEALGQARAKASAAAVMLELSQRVPAYTGCRYRELAWTEKQDPPIGEDLWYGGTALLNRGGLGVQIPSTADTGPVQVEDVMLPEAPRSKRGKLLVVPLVSLYNRERAFRPSDVVAPRVPLPFALLNLNDAKRLKLAAGDTVEIEIDDGPAVQVLAKLDAGMPAGSLGLPRHLTTTAMPLTLAAGKIARVAVPTAGKVAEHDA